MDVGSLFIADAQAAKLIKPSEGSLHHPSPSAQSAAMISVSFGKPRLDVAGTQTLPDRFGVITTVAQHTIRTMARSSSLSLQRWDGINQCEGLLRVVTIRSCELDGKGNSTTVTN
jgi:hypothetical protein